MEYDLIENKSKIYYNGSIWDSDNYGKFEVVGKLNKYRIYKGLKKFTLFLCKFIDDDTLFEVEMSTIKTGDVKNKNFKSRVINIIDNIEIIKNTSKVYYNGSIWKTNNCGNIKILERTNKLDTEGIYSYLLCEFEDGTKLVVFESAIKQGSVMNPNKPSVYGIGYIGQGNTKSIKNNKTTKKYSTWNGMLSRCYNKKDTSYKDYGGKGITVDPRWHNLQDFATDIETLEGYEEWLNIENKLELDKDILCNELNIHPKIYSKNTCKFVTSKENSNNSDKSNKLTGLVYIAHRIEDGYEEEFINQREFSRKYKLSQGRIWKCIFNNKDITKGWRFKIKEEINE